MWLTEYITVCSKICFLMYESNGRKKKKVISIPRASKIRSVDWKIKLVSSSYHQSIVATYPQLLWTISFCSIERKTKLMFILNAPANVNPLCSTCVLISSSVRGTLCGLIYQTKWNDFKPKVTNIRRHCFSAVVWMFWNTVKKGVTVSAWMF